MSGSSTTCCVTWRRSAGRCRCSRLRMARLWEHRDRERGLLTRRGYEEIGGVAGALAQHAEATLETHWRRARPDRAGDPAQPGDGRRDASGPGMRRAALRLRRPAREAEEVLDRLVEARLLTSFEAPSEEGGTTGHRRLEIIHESLLASWPRLARWRDQDAEGARLRDQLRQAARLWDERGRPIGLLWTRPVVRGVRRLEDRAMSAGSTALEQAFGEAMEAQAGRRRLPDAVWPSAPPLRRC